MHYVGLLLWIVGFAAVVAWGQTFKKKTYNIIGRRGTFYIVSAILVTVALASLGLNGVNKGLDFTGGTIIEAGIYEMTTVNEVRTAMDKFKSDEVTLSGIAIQTGTEMVDDQKPDEGKPAKFQRIILRVVDENGNQLQPAQAEQVFEHMKAELGDMKQLRTASIGPTISGELTNNAIKAVLLALGLQLVYIFFRFGNQIRYGLAADVALVHDVIIMIGFYSLAGKEIDSPFVAALLTVVGYSVMDSVVIFDRIRENINDWWDEHGDEGEAPYEEIVNDSINQTMTRSINTTLTTLVTLLAIYYFGGSTLQDFAFALLVGIVSGAYSSIFLASPILVAINSKYPIRPVQAMTWGSVDDEVVPEDYLEDETDAAPQRPVRKTKKAGPKLVEDEETNTGGRRRSRGKRS
ncbi:MAG: protein translocase subunit SecF [Candidatus Eremiobacteraeota bacterium]|nr:protein translocase subunit SecF [Candidatus Eremiobacteraeota bacterium]